MKRVLPVYISDNVRSDFESVAEAGHMNGAKYAATWISELAQLKPEFALKVLGLIPPEWKHRRPGRPSGSTGTHHKVAAEVAAQDVA